MNYMKELKSVHETILEVKDSGKPTDQIQLWKLASAMEYLVTALMEKERQKEDKPDKEPTALVWDKSCQYISSNGCIHMDWTKSSAYVSGGALCYTEDCPLVK